MVTGPGRAASCATGTFISYDLHRMSRLRLPFQIRNGSMSRENIMVRLKEEGSVTAKIIDLGLVKTLDE